MDENKIKKLWSDAIGELLDSKLDDVKLNILAKQTYDSIRRVEIYKTYKIKAEKAVKENTSFYYTSNPFILAQRPDLSFENKIWVIYIATYFGKSNSSKWDLFNRACFKSDKSLIKFSDIKLSLDDYFEYLSSFDFFANCNYSNHRKFTAKRLEGNTGVLNSMGYLVKNISNYTPNNLLDFDSMYRLSQKIPNFGRLAAFDFTCSLVKCNLKIKEPLSMYSNYSTGPLLAIKLLFRLTGNRITSQKLKEFDLSLVEWFLNKNEIFMVGQVLEDAICNWQKNTTRYIRYTG